MNKNNWEEPSGSFPEDSFIKPQDAIGRDRPFHFPEETPETPASNASSGWPDPNGTDYESTSQPYWWDSASAAPENEEDFVSVLPADYDTEATLGRTEKPTADPFSAFPVQMTLSWLPPKPPTAFDGFNILIEREGEAWEWGRVKWNWVAQGGVKGPGGNAHGQVIFLSQETQVVLIQGLLPGIRSYSGGLTHPTSFPVLAPLQPHRVPVLPTPSSLIRGK